MISLTRREFDTVSADLTDAWLEARRRERLPQLLLVRQDKDKSKKQPDKRTHKRIVNLKSIPH